MGCLFLIGLRAVAGLGGIQAGRRYRGRKGTWALTIVVVSRLVEY